MVSNIWEHLGRVRSLTFSARSAHPVPSGWVGEGTGQVEVERPGESVLVFNERGSWRDGGGRRLGFRNALRWTLDPAGDRLRLEHLRFGADCPVYLFDLVLSGGGVLVSEQPHACREDQYAARLTLDGAVVGLYWKVTGPGTNSEVNFFYRPDDRHLA